MFFGGLLFLYNQTRKTPTTDMPLSKPSSQGQSLPGATLMLANYYSFPPRLFPETISRCQSSIKQWFPDVRWINVSITRAEVLVGDVTTSSAVVVKSLHLSHHRPWVTHHQGLCGEQQPSTLQQWQSGWTCPRHLKCLWHEGKSTVAGAAGCSCWSNTSRGRPRQTDYLYILVYLHSGYDPQMMWKYRVCKI